MIFDSIGTREMNRRQFLRSVGASGTALCLPGCLSSLEANPFDEARERPNIIFVMVDDMGIGDAECYGQKLIRTPRIDAMAREGMRHTACYTASPVCAPSRCSLMTGLHTGHCRRRGNRTTAHRNDLEATNGLLPLAKDDFTVASMMKKAGYATGGFGKWGLGNPGTTGTPDRHGFDLFYGYLDQVHAHDYYTDFLYRNDSRETIPPGDDGRQPYSHHLIVDEMFRFIRRNREKPFFCYAPWTPPHGKYVIPDQGLYKDEPWDDRFKNYAAMITQIDSDLGRLLDLLKELGIEEKTIVFFTSDNGPNKPFLKPFDSNGIYRGIKRQLYEGGIRMPMITRWPGTIPAGGTSDFVWTFTDFMPTAAHLAGIEPPDGMDGFSVLPTLLGRQQDAHDYLYWEFHDPFHQAVRKGKWKGIRFGTKKPMQLYDIAEDPSETTDKAADHPEVVAALSAIMDEAHTDSVYWPLK